MVEQKRLGRRRGEEALVLGGAEGLLQRLGRAERALAWWRAAGVGLAVALAGAVVWQMLGR